VIQAPTQGATEPAPAAHPAASGSMSVLFTELGQARESDMSSLAHRWVHRTGLGSREGARLDQDGVFHDSTHTLAFDLFIRFTNTHDGNGCAAKPPR